RDPPTPGGRPGGGPPQVRRAAGALRRESRHVTPDPPSPFQGEGPGVGLMPGLVPTPPQSARHATHAWISSTPAQRNTRATSPRVAPVVSTSSTTATRA